MSLDSFINKFGGWSEEYFFYQGTVTLRYDPKKHIYYLLTDEGDLERLYGVTSVVHIIDKSEALVPWGCKMMSEKLMRTIPGSQVAGTIIMTQAELDKWITEAKGAHKEKLEEAGAIGHMAHNWVEQYIKFCLAKDEAGKEKHLANFPADEKAKNGCIAALDWMSKHNVRWLCTERKIYSRTYKYAGTMDGLCTCDSCDNPKCCPTPFKDRLSVADWKTSNYLYMEYLFQTAAYQQAYTEEMLELVLDRWIIRLGKDDAEFEAWHREEHTFQMDWAGFVDALKLNRTVEVVKKNLQERESNLRAAVKAEKQEARRLKDESEAKVKALTKEKKQQERTEALAKACGPSKKYKGLKKPSCKTNKGNPCEACAGIYAKKREEKAALVVVIQTEKPKAPTLSALAGLLKKPKPAEPKSCDGEHGGPACGLWWCWQGYDWDELFWKYVPRTQQLCLPAMATCGKEEWQDYLSSK